MQTTDPIVLPSGARLNVAVPSFAHARTLQMAIARELVAVKLDFNFGQLDLSNISAKDINTLKDVVLQLTQSSAVDAAIMVCAEKSLYNGQRITAETFENPRARVDYYPVAWEVIKAAVGPFFKGLASLLPSPSEAQPSNAPTSAAT